MKSGVSGSLRRKLFRAANYTCEECGLRGYEHRTDAGSFLFPTCVDRVYLSIDHIVPRSRGGSSEPANLRVLCTYCNSFKGTKVTLRETMLVAKTEAAHA